MGLSLLNIAKKIGDVASGVERQVNFRDGGATYSNPHPAPQPPAPQPQAPAPNPYQANPQQLQQNINSEHGPNANNPGMALWQPFVNSLKTAGQGIQHNIIQDWFTRPAAEIGSTITDHTIQPGGNPLTRAVFGSTPIQPVQQDVRGVYQANKNSKNPLRQKFAPLIAAGDVGLHIAQDVPVVGGSVKAAVKLTKLAKGAEDVADATKAAVAEKPTVTPTQPTVTPKPTVSMAADAQQAKPTSSVVLRTPPKTGITTIDKTIQDMYSHYNDGLLIKNNGIAGVVQAARGAAGVGQYNSSLLSSALRKGLTKEERNAVYDALEGVANPNLTARAGKVAKSLKALNDKGFDVRASINPSLRNVGAYAPRILRSTVQNAVHLAGGKAAKIQSVFDLGNLESNFNKSRLYQKFVGNDGSVVYGKPSEQGIVSHQDGSFTNGKKGNNKVVYKPTPTNIHELQDNLGLQYLNDAAHVHGLYHGDTARLQAKAQALQELNANPTKHGLFTRGEVETGGLDNMREVNVQGLKDPNGENFYASAKDAKMLERDRLLGRADARSLPGKVYDALANTATQFIVLNPAFHGANQLVQSLIAAGKISGNGGGWIRLAHGILSVDDGVITDYLRNGGHIPDYGASRVNTISRLTGGASKLNNKAMAAIELKLRTGLYKASLDGGMTADEAVKNIDKFLGDSHQLSRATQRVTLFAHYLKTMGEAAGSSIVHPIENRGATINAAALAALLLGANKAYQEFTGNPNAYVRMPGELGLVKEGVKAVNEARQGEVPSVVTNHINPVAKELGQQVANEDLFTQKHVTDMPGGRAGHAVSSLIAPSQQASQISSGKRTPLEIVQNQAGAYTPHAGPTKDKQTGEVTQPAAPAVLKGPLKVINEPGAKVREGNDPTGYKQQQLFFSTTKEARKALSGDDQKLFDQLTASTSKLNDKQIQGHYADLSSNPKVLEAIVKQKQVYAAKTGTSLDPLYSNKFTPAQRQEYLHMLSLPYKGDDYVQQQGANGDSKDANGWMYQLTQARNDYFQKNKFAGASKSERVQPPSFDPQTQSDMNMASGLSGAEKAKFISDHPKVQAAYDAIAQYTNDKRVAQGNAPFKLYPKADAATNSAINEYNALPQHDGKKGGNATRAKWIQANPGKYSLIQDYYSNTAAYQLAANAGEAKYQGADLNQAALKAAYDLGKYDIAKTKDANGGNVYSINPAAAYSQGAVSSSSSFNSSSSASYRDAKYLANSEKRRVHGKSGKFKGPKVSIKNSTGGAKTSLKAPSLKLSPMKVSLKKSKV